MNEKDLMNINIGDNLKNRNIYIAADSITLDNLENGRVVLEGENPTFRIYEVANKNQSKYGLNIELEGLEEPEELISYNDNYDSWNVSMKYFFNVAYGEQNYYVFKFANIGSITSYEDFSEGYLHTYITKNIAEVIENDNKCFYKGYTKAGIDELLEEVPRFRRLQSYCIAGVVGDMYIDGLKVDSTHIVSCMIKKDGTDIWYEDNNEKIKINLQEDGYIHYENTDYNNDYEIKLLICMNR